MMLYITHLALLFILSILLMDNPHILLFCALVDGRPSNHNPNDQHLSIKKSTDSFGNYDKMMDYEDPIPVKYSGGRVMTDPIKVALLWFGSGWSHNSNQAMLNAISSLTPDKNQASDVPSEVPSLRNWWKIVTQYRDSNGRPATDTVRLGPECFYTGSTENITRDHVNEVGRAVFNQRKLDGFGRNLTCTALFEVDNNTVYHILFSGLVMFENGDEQLDFIDNCSGKCHQWQIEEGKFVTMVWERQPQKGNDQCSSLLSQDLSYGPPNGDEKFDALISFVLGKTVDQVTNSDGNGWTAGIDGSPDLSSLCPSPTGWPYQDPPRTVFHDDQKNVGFNVQGLNGYRYLVQQLWNAKVGNCGLQYSEPWTSTVTVRDPKGYISIGIIANHTSGLQPYPPNLNCQWKIQSPNAKFIRLNLTYMAITTMTDILSFYTMKDNGNGCHEVLGGQECLFKTFGELNSCPEMNKLQGSEVLVKFSSGHNVSETADGWEIRYEAGFCDGKENIYDHLGIITDGSPTGVTYLSDLRCYWVFHGKFGTPISLQFTRLNTTKDLDFIAIYNGTEELMDHQLVNYSGLYLGASLPHVTFMGPILVAFSTQAEESYGWAAHFNISSPVPRKRENRKFVIVMVVSVGTLLPVFIFIIIVMIVFRRQRVKNYASVMAVTNREQELEIISKEKKEEKNLNLYLQVRFTRENIIGEGSSAVVYKGTLPDGQAVAVKKPMIDPTMEAEILYRISHGNVISLIGYSEEKQDDERGIKVLVFEFMENGSLSHNLHGKGTYQGFILSWRLRLQIAVQISLGLQFLHIYSYPRIAHGNVTTDNVLLDSSWNAKLGGFGGSIFCKHSQETPTLDRNSFTTPGYIDPDLLQSGSSIMAADVYSFGVVLLELLSGHKARDSSFDHPELANWGPDLVQNGQALKLLDCRLEIPRAENEITALLKMAEVAVWCVNSRGRTRPTIGDVVTSLQQVLNIFLSTGDIVLTGKELPGPSTSSLHSQNNY